MKKLLLFITLIFLFSCENDNEEVISSCVSDLEIDQSRGDCKESINFTSEFNITTTNNERIISSNNIPDHLVGLFGGGQGSLNPNEISPQFENYVISCIPTVNPTLTSLLNDAGQGQNLGPQYAFGIMLNGIELDPVAAEPFPHNGNLSDPNNNWEWNKEALNVNLGLDCNNGHVQPNGKYHYHATPVDYLNSLGLSNNEMTLVGYAADGFPIYYKYAYSVADNNNSKIQIMKSSYQLKSGYRPGDGINAPCDEYNGVYSNDYEYVENLGTLDEANGRSGVTPEYPNGTYYYVLTDDFPGIPRYFKGSPSDSFKIIQ